MVWPTTPPTAELIDGQIYAMARPWVKHAGASDTVLAIPIVDPPEGEFVEGAGLRAVLHPLRVGHRAHELERATGHQEHDQARPELHASNKGSVALANRGVT
jgi:hypothetical protein